MRTVAGLLGLGEPNSVLAEVVDGVVAAQEHVSDDPDLEAGDVET